MGDTPRVLVVEDDLSVQEIIVEICASVGAEVVAMADGQKAIDLLGRESFGLVMTDLHLPGRTGDHVARFTRERHPGTKVVLLSATWSDDERVRALYIPCDLLVPKPFTVDHITEVVRRFLVLPAAPVP